MQRALTETHRRREIQLAYNAEHGITPRSVTNAIKNGIDDAVAAHVMAQEVVGQAETHEDTITAEYLEELHQEMLKAAEELDFERAALLRDKIATLKGEKVASAQVKKPRGKRGGKGKPSGGSVPSDSAPSGHPRRPPRPRPSG
jgi:excinuclease ABC subunit B